MAPNQRSFAQRMASMASTIENWDDDGDFQGDLFTTSVGTAQSISSRVSVRSESNTGDDDWQVLIRPDDKLSKFNAISSAKQAGIPIPTTVPSSALLGGSIQRLGKKKSNRKIVVDEDWGDDLELPQDTNEKLKLKPPAPLPRTPADDNDDFDDWGEGSLGIRFAGTRRDGRGGRSSSVSAMSPSMGSCMTLESEDDDLGGLILPNEPLDFNARLEKLKKTEHSTTPDVSPLPQKRELPPTSVPLTTSPVPPTSTPPLQQAAQLESKPEAKLKPTDDEGDFLDGLDIGASSGIDTSKLTVNRNVIVKKQPSKQVAPPAARPATTLTFTDKPSASKIPRPLPSNRSRLAPLYESGASTISNNRPMPTTTSAQLLRAKRSAPLLRSNNNNYSAGPRPPVPFLPAGSSNSKSHHITTKTSQGHLRRESDPSRPQSPVLRSYSRMSAAQPPDTPSRNSMRKDVAPSALAREAAAKRVMAKPKTKKNYGDGSELEIFDDLPTSATKEKKFEKAPSNRTATVKTLRHQTSNTRLPMPDRMATPLPQTPRSPTKADSTPRFARDTAASRIAREERLAGTRSRGEGPIAPTRTNWKAQVAARSPHASPTAQRKSGTGKKPMLIHAMSHPMSKNEKGMTYNPILQRWEGNEEALSPFSLPNTSSTTLALTTASTPTFAPPGNRFHSHDRSHSISHTALSAIQAAHGHRPGSSRAANVGPPSPPRAPALITQVSTTRGVQVERGMVFDPQKMKWLKLGRSSSRAGDPLSPSVDGDDEEDPFAGLDDLKDDDKSQMGPSGSMAIPTLGETPKLDEPSFIGEEFDLGPSFIRRQREEEAVWRRRVEGWVGGIRDIGDGWRWAVRDLAALASAEALKR